MPEAADLPLALRQPPRVPKPRCESRHDLLIFDGYDNAVGVAADGPDLACRDAAVSDEGLCRAGPGPAHRGARDGAISPRKSASGIPVQLVGQVIGAWPQHAARGAGEVLASTEAHLIPGPVRAVDRDVGGARHCSGPRVGSEAQGSSGD